jgi:hypothetical protein
MCNLPKIFSFKFKSARADFKGKGRKTTSPKIIANTTIIDDFILTSP